jgi:hypothetical protein
LYIASGTALALVILCAMAVAGLHITQWEITKRWAANFFPQLKTEATTVSQRNPFLAFVGEPDIRFHPFIDMAGVYVENGDKEFFKQRDYFGFRNRFDAYSNPGDYRYIVLTGNSEAVGLLQKTTIAERLQRILNERTGSRFRVLNLAMNGATTANEINYFVNLGFRLKPEFVISHSFVTDVYYGILVPEEFRRLGLVYAVLQTTWSKDINRANLPSRAFEIPSAPPGTFGTLDAMVANIRRYKAIAGAAGAQFVWGVQKFDWHHTIGSPAEANWRRVDDHYQEFRRRIADFSGIDVIDFNTVSPPIELGGKLDPIHTKDDSAERIAQIYADWIIPRLHDPDPAKSQENRN